MDQQKVSPAIRVDDAELVHEKKILLFLKEDVLTMRTPKKGVRRVDS
jgi:hypothetical protein